MTFPTLNATVNQDIGWERGRIAFACPVSILSLSFSFQTFQTPRIFPESYAVYL